MMLQNDKNKGENYMIDLSNENMIHIKSGDIEYLQFRKLLEYKDKIVHCYTLKGNNNDYKEITNNNYEKLYNILGLNFSKFKRIEHQIHSDKVEIVDDLEKIYTDIDGLLTNIDGTSLSLRYADCTPVYLYDPVKNVIGNIHSGWRGTIQKIAPKAVLKMIKEYGSNSEDIICCIGPAIGKCHFEVSEDVKDIFKETFSYLLNEDEFIFLGKIKDGEQKYYIDTNIINRKMLEEVGLKPENIIESNICTVCNKDLIHSYRADKENSGRNTAIIGFVEK